MEYEINILLSAKHAFHKLFLLEKLHKTLVNAGRYSSMKAIVDLTLKTKLIEYHFLRRHLLVRFIVSVLR